MPVFPTTTRCPICHEVFSGVVPRWHYKDVHPEYYVWNNTYRKKLNWVLPWPFIAAAILLLPIAIPSQLLTALFFGSFVPLLVGLIPELRAAGRFRREWKALHPIDSPHYTPPKLAIEGSLFAVIALVLVTTALFLGMAWYSIFLFWGGVFLLGSGFTMAMYGRFFGPNKPTVESIGVVSYVGQNQTLYVYIPFLIGLMGLVFVGALVENEPTTVSLPVWVGYFVFWGGCEVLALRHSAHSSRRIIRNHRLSEGIGSLHSTNHPQEMPGAREAGVSDLELCPHCAATVSRNSVFCPICGGNLRAR